MSLAANIQPAPKIVYMVPLEDRPMDWDLADEVTENMFTTELLLKYDFYTGLSFLIVNVL
ncbi:MAG: hypothetical protein ACMG6E_10715, partial [Candidatus Roizmanbacteria bacterium]